MFRLCLALALAAVCLLVLHAYSPVAHPAGPDSATATLITEAEMIPQQDTGEWLERVFGRRRPEAQAPSSLGSRGLDDSQLPPIDGQERWPGRETTYRTLCVRLCDGYYFPISYATRRDRFAQDRKQCDQRCPGARLHVYRNPGEGADDMVDLEGRPYRKLTTAFVYRTEYIAGCTCQGNPWDEAALARHRAYAAAATRAAQAKSAENAKPKRDSKARWAPSADNASSR
jgi:hypothetical protein